MSVNKYKPHMMVLPEDRRNAEIATGLTLSPAVNSRAIQVLPEAGGWTHVLEQFESVLAPSMSTYKLRNVLLIIDFDNSATRRFNRVRKSVPTGLVDRVLVLGVLSEPEKLKGSIGMRYEDIGRSLSQDCCTRTIWGHALLKHNNNELYRMIPIVKQFLFS